MKSSLRHLFPVLLFSLITSSLPTIAEAALADDAPKKILSGWMPYYSTRTSLASIETNTAYVKEVMPFWYTVKYDSAKKKMRILDLYTDFVGPKGRKASSVIESITAMGKSVIPTITDGTTENVLSGLLADAKSRTELVVLITNLVEDNEYSGIDLDFEGFAFVDKQATWKKTSVAWVAFIRELSASLHLRNKLLSVATPYVWDPKSKQKGYYVYAWEEIASSIDRLRFMAYDYSTSRPGPIGPISWTEKTLKYATSIMPPSKVYLGLPGYTRGWITAIQGVCPSDVAGAIKLSAKTEAPMSEVRRLRDIYNFVPKYDETFQEMSFSYDMVYNGLTKGKLATSCTASRTFWYQDQKALTVRAALVPKYKLGGIAMWTLGMEDENAFDGIREIARKYAQKVVTSNLRSSLESIDYGQQVDLEVKVTINNGLPLSNQLVSIERYSSKEGTWKQVASGSTDVQGFLTRKLYLGKNSTLRAVTSESDQLTASASQSIDVTVSRLIFTTPPASVIAREAFTVKGSIRPRSEGAFIQVEKFSDGKWQTFGAPGTTDSQGNFVIPFTGQGKGVLTLRLSASAEERWIIATTEPFSILIRGVGTSELVK